MSEKINSVESGNNFSVSDSFNSVDHQRLCAETLHVVNDAKDKDDDEVSGPEMEFQGLTILAFLQSSLVQSMSLSHKEISPVSQYHGLQVCYPTL